MRGQIGDLRINDKVYKYNKTIVQFKIPILSVYKNEDTFYLLSCLDVNEYQYLLYKIEKKTLISLLMDNTKVEDAFIAETYFYIEFTSQFRNYKFTKYRSNELLDDFKPESDVYLGLSELQEIKNYVNSLVQTDDVSRKLMRTIYSSGDELIKYIDIRKDYDKSFRKVLSFFFNEDVSRKLSKDINKLSLNYFPALIKNILNNDIVESRTIEIVITKEDLVAFTSHFVHELPLKEDKPFIEMNEIKFSGFLMNILR